MTSRILPLSDPVPERPFRLRDFWRFVVERQTIYQKRFVLHEPPPWTKDPVLKEYFFTNVYRELDKGTRFWTDNIAPHCHEYVDLVWNLLVYRYFNEIPTYEALVVWYGRSANNNGIIPYRMGWNHTEVAKFLSKREREGHKPFTSAFTVTGVRFGGYPDKIRNVCYLLEQLHSQVPRVVGRLARCNDLRNVFDTFFGLDGIGPFLAYELAIDINYPHTLVQCSEDDFVNPGPGCMAGLRYIYGHRTKSEYMKLIHWLRWNQQRFLEEYGLVEQWFAVYPGYPLSLRSIEHSLCEFSKYARTKYGETAYGVKCNNKTRRYHLKPQDQGQLVLV